MGQIIPISIAVAISSVPIMTAMFILLSPNRSRAAVPFLSGWVVGILSMVFACTLAAQAVPTGRSPRRPDSVVGTLEIIIGLGLLVLAVVWFVRARRATESSLPKWLSSSARLGPWSSFGLGLVLNLRPKGLLLAIAGGLTIRADASTLPLAILAILTYTMIGSSTVAVPIIAVLIAPDRMKPRLVAATRWMQRYGATITCLMLVVVGVVVIGMGIARL